MDAEENERGSSQNSGDLKIGHGRSGVTSIPKVQLAASVFFMFLAVLIGIFRLMNLHSINIYPIFLTALYQLHPNIMVYGFLAPIVMTERLVGMKTLHTGRIYSLSATLMVPATLIGLILQIGGFVSEQPVLISAGGGIIFLGLILFIILMFGLSMKTGLKLPFYLMILSVIPVADFALLSVRSIEVDGMPDSLLLMLFPILFILGERVELSRFVSGNLERYGKYVLSLGILVVLLTVMLANFQFSMNLSMMISLVTFALLFVAGGLTMFLEAKNLIHVSRSTSPLQKYVSKHVMVAYAWLMVGCAFGVAYSIQAPGFIYDAVIHSLMVGYVGSMLLAHGPVILPTVTGRKINQSTLTLIPLILILVSNVFRISGDFQLGGVIQAIVSFASGISGWLVLVAVLVFLRSLVFSKPLIQSGPVL